MPLRTRLAALHRLFVVTLLGFASGLPLALTRRLLEDAGHPGLGPVSRPS